MKAVFWESAWLSVQVMLKKIVSGCAALKEIVESVKTWLFCTAEPVELKDEARLYLHNTEMCQAFFSPLLSNVSSGFHSTNHSRLLELLN